MSEEGLESTVSTLDPFVNSWREGIVKRRYRYEFIRSTFAVYEPFTIVFADFSLSVPDLFVFVERRQWAPLLGVIRKLSL